MQFMIQEGPDGAGQILFPIKFETDQNYIDFDTIRRSTEGVRDTFLGSNIALYGAQTDVKIIFGAAEAGSVINWVGRTAIFTAGIVAGPLADGFVEGVTGKTIQEWGKVATEAALEFPEKLSELTQEQHEELTKRFIDAETCRRFLEMTEDEFESAISERPDAAETIQNGRRKFYEACKANEQLPSVKFGVSASTLSIPRNEFSSRTKRRSIARQKTLLVETGRWSMETLEIEVTSPNWERLDQQRGWKGKLSDGKYIYFHIDDSRFWAKRQEGSLLTSTPDIMVAQIIFRDVAGRYKDAKALKILNFNNEDISSPISDDKARELVNSYAKASSELQNPLFDEKDD